MTLEPPQNFESLKSAPGAFPHWETKIMARLGIRDRDCMRELRAKALGEGDWQLVKGRVCLTDGAVGKLQAYLAGTDSRSPANSQATAVCDPRRLLPEKSASSLPSVFQVVKAAPHNPHVLICVPEGCSLDDLSARVSVKVKDNRNFLPRSRTGVILAERSPNGTWEFAGRPTNENNSTPRCPRYRGQW